jgi:hypothetical protein
MDCTENGCVEAGRWAVGERRYCSTHGIQASIRGSVAMRLVCPVVEPDSQPVSVWDELQAELDFLSYGSLGQERLLALAQAAIEHGRIGSL